VNGAAKGVTVSKAHRNDPCPCGSGKKYKKCCMLVERDLAGVRADNRAVVQEAVNWLSMQHGDSLAHWVENVWFAGLDAEQRKGLSTADPAIRAVHDTNVLEHMVAEGSFVVDDKETRVLDIILGAALDLSDSQRAYLEQLATNSLYLYSVSRCEPGTGFALQRFPEGGEDVFIEDKWTSRMLDVGDVVGLRLMQTGGEWETSGAVYHLPGEYIEALSEQLSACEDAQYSMTLIRYWLALVAAHV